MKKLLLTAILGLGALLAAATAGEVLRDSLPGPALLAAGGLEGGDAVGVFRAPHPLRPGVLRGRLLDGDGSPVGQFVGRVTADGSVTGHANTHLGRGPLGGAIEDGELEASIDVPGATLLLEGEIEGGSFEGEWEAEPTEE